VGVPPFSESIYNITAVAFTAVGPRHVAGQYFVEVYDLPGEATVDGPADVNAGSLYTLDLGYADPGSDSVFKWEINWGDGNIDEAAGSFTSPTHVYENAGVYPITVTATTEEGEEDEADPFNVTVNAAQQDGVFLVNGQLSVIDTNPANDIVTISQSNGSISVTSNGGTPVVFTESVNSIEVVLGTGHDIVVVGSNITVPLTIDGGAGNDFLSAGGGPATLIGGPGNDILWGGPSSDKLFGGDNNDDLFGGGGNDSLVGGAGNDIVHGGAGRDLNIGGENEDLLIGGGDEDILIGGATSQEVLDNLDEIMEIWGATGPLDTFLNRIALLTAAGGLLESGVDVFADDAMDIIVGGAGRDLVFGDTNPADGVFDILALSPVQDVLVALDDPV
jgi:Ca2+-binding RTX toxin-like protein